jgi:hypothetical protein
LIGHRLQNEWNFLTLLVILAGIVSLTFLKRLVLPILMDLLDD